MTQTRWRCVMILLYILYKHALVLVSHLYAKPSSSSLVSLCLPHSLKPLKKKNFLCNSETLEILKFRLWAICTSA